MTGAELRAERQRRKLTLEQLGELLGVSRQRVGFLESSEWLTPAQTSAIAAAFGQLDGAARPRGVPLACPICGHDCATGPASPAYVMLEHVRTSHRDRFGRVEPPTTPTLSPIPSAMRGYRVQADDPGSLSTDPLTLQVVFDDYPYSIFPLPLEGRIAYQWIPGSVPEEGRLS